MKITRNVNEIGKGYGGVVEIELTPKEVLEAYELQRKEYMAQDIAQNISDRIEDDGLEDKFAEDWSMRVGERYASDFVSRLDNYDYYWEIYNDFLRETVERYLRELGYDPDTMEKEDVR